MYACIFYNYLVYITMIIRSFILRRLRVPYEDIYFWMYTYICIYNTHQHNFCNPRSLDICSSCLISLDCVHRIADTADHLSMSTSTLQKYVGAFDGNLQTHIKNPESKDSGYFVHFTTYTVMISLSLLSMTYRFQR